MANGLPEENKIKPVPVPNMFSPSRPDLKPPGSRVDPAVATPFQKFGGRVTGDLAWAGKQMGETAARAVGVAERIPGAVRDFWKWGNSVPGAAKDTARAAVQQVAGGGGQAAPMGSALNRPQMTQGDNANVLASPNTPVIAPPPQAGQGGSAASIPTLYTNRPEVAWDKGGYYLSREGGNFEPVAPGMGQERFEKVYGKEGYQANPTRRAEAAAAAESSAVRERAPLAENTGWENIGGGEVYGGGGGGYGRGGGDYDRRESVPDIPMLGNTENALIKAGMAYEKRGGFFARTPRGSTWIPERIIPTGSASSMVNARANEEQNRVSRENALTQAGVQSQGNVLRYRADIGQTEQRREEAAAQRELTREGYGYDILGKRITAQSGLERAGISAGAKQAGEGLSEYEYGRLRNETLDNDFAGEYKNPDGSINEEKLAARLGYRGPAASRSNTLPQGRQGGRWETRVGPGGQQQRRWVAQ